MEMLKNVSNANIQDSLFNNVGRDYVQTTINSTSVLGNLESPAPKFLDLLPHIDCERYHNFVRSSIRTRSTVGQWLLDSEIYNVWKSGGGGSSTRLLWLNGIPGVGKTVICSRVIDDLRDNQTHHPVAFFYCGELDTSTRCDSKNILASLLRQLLNYTPLDHSKFSLILKRYQRTEEVDDCTLTTFIQEVSNLYEKTFIVIDALDECCNPKAMLPEFGILAEKLCIFISSRDHADIRTTFKRYKQIRVREDDIIEDIRQYVNHEITGIKIQNTKLRDSVIDELVIGAQGSFLWPVSQIQRLRKAKTNKKMEDIMASIPQGMRITIEKSLRTIDSKKNSEILCSALQLVVFALRPITLQALAEVMGTLEMKDTWDPDLITREPRDLVDNFAGLLICVSGKERNRYESCWSTGFGDDDIVVPFHQCVKKYLLANPVMLHSDLKKYSLFPSHDSIAKLCLKYQNLVFKHTDSLDLEPAHYPFAEYALRGWLPHYLASGKNIDDLQKHAIAPAMEEANNEGDEQEWSEEEGEQVEGEREGEEEEGEQAEGEGEGEEEEGEQAEGEEDECENEDDEVVEEDEYCENEDDEVIEEGQYCENEDDEAIEENEYRENEDDEVVEEDGDDTNYMAYDGNGYEEQEIGENEMVYDYHQQNLRGRVRPRQVMPLHSGTGYHQQNLRGRVRPRQVMPLDSGADYHQQNLRGRVRPRQVMPLDSGTEQNLRGRVRPRQVMPLDSGTDYHQQNLPGRVRPRQVMPLDSGTDNNQQNLPGRVRPRQAMPLDSGTFSSRAPKTRAFNTLEPDPGRLRSNPRLS